MTAAPSGSGPATSAGSGPATTAAPTGGTSAPAGNARELVIARDMDTTTLDLSLTYCDTCQIFITAVYETLITVDPADPNTILAAAGHQLGGQRRQHGVHVHARSRGDVRRQFTG